MGLDILLLQDDRGGNIESVRASQRLRFASVELVDEVLALHKASIAVTHEGSMLRKELNTLNKEIGMKMKAKLPADELVQNKKDMEVKIAALAVNQKEAEEIVRKKLQTIGNLVHSSVPVSESEEENVVERVYHPDGLTPNGEMTKPQKGVGKTMTEGVLSHHEVMYRLDCLEMERGSKVAGHRGYFLTGVGVDLNQALISYGLDFLEERDYKKVQPPFFMNRAQMAKTAQLSEFDEALYKLEGDGEDSEKYLIATSEQPLSALHSEEVFERPAEQLPIKYAGYSTCFRKEAGSSGRDVLGIFRVHQFEKIEQFCITDPNSSWEMFDHMIENSEAFYQSLGLSYQLISIVSGALNNAAAKKYDLEAWFPFHGEYKELVSVSNCTDYQSRTLEIRSGAKKTEDGARTYVHMLNGTLCATERALCCLVENYQTPEGLAVPLALQPYLKGRTFLPYKRELPTPIVAKAKKA